MSAFPNDARGALGAALVVAVLAAGCASGSKEQSSSVAGAGSSTTAAPSESNVKEPTMAAGTMPVKPDVEPQHVEVQHILIGFTGSVPQKPITRTKEEAKTLAYQLLERARAGEDFDGLVRQYTDDSPPGIYAMSAVGVTPLPGEYPRNQMVAAFGNVGFAVSPGNIGIADWDPSTSPYGWHIIKRLK